MSNSSSELSFIDMLIAGNTALDFIKQLGLPMTRDNRLCVQDNLQIGAKKNAFAIGDCAAHKENPLPMLAQVANQQGKHLADIFNKNDLERPFKFQFRGSMAQLGLFQAVADLPLGGAKLTGFAAFLTWRSAYWTLTVSIANKILIPM